MEPIAATKSAIEIVKGADEIIQSRFATSLFGPAIGEFAESLRDTVRVYRYGRELKLLQKAKKMTEDAGFTPRAVPIKVLFPLLEGASLEEDEDLHTMWAAMLANAANPKTPDFVHPSFAGTLKQLSPMEAKVLDSLYLEVSRRFAGVENLRPNRKLLSSAYLAVGPVLTQTASDSDRQAHYEHLNRFYTLETLGLVSRPTQSELGHMAELTRNDELFFLTTRGYEFTKACQPPAPSK